MIIGDIKTTEKVEYEDLLKNYYEKMEIIEEQGKKIESINGALQTYEILLQSNVLEIERLKKELNELNTIMQIGREREYHSKFLKDFQKERGKNVFPDHDEIYKRYDDYKGRVERTIKYIRSNEWGIDYEHSNCRTHLLEILKGSDKE